MSTPAVLYAAKSTVDEHGSIPTQHADGFRLAAERGDEVVDQFQDEAASAYHGDRGPGLAGAMALCERLAAEHGTCALIVQHSDRLARGDARQARHLVEVVLWAIKNNVQLLSVQDPEMLSGGELGLLMGVIGGMRNNQDSKRKGLAVKDGIRRSVVERGRYFGGRRPYGYCYEAWIDATGKRQSRLVIDPAEAAVVRRMFDEYIAGRAQNAIARDLQREGVPTLTASGSWYATTVAGILKNPLYVGMVTLHGEQFPAVGPDGEPTHEPIIDRETWEAACQLRAARSAEGPPRGRGTAGRHLLTEGLLRCTCGVAMSPVTKKDRRAANRIGYESYHCLKRLHYGPDACPQPPIKRELVDNAVYRYFERVALDEDATRRAVKEQAARSLSESEVRRHEAETELARAEARLSKITRGWQDEVIDDAEFGRQRADVDAQREAAQAQLEQHERRKQEIDAAIAVFDVEKAIAEEMTMLRRIVAGQIRDGSSDDLAALRATLKRLFAGFELQEAGSFAFPTAGRGVPWIADDPEVEKLLEVGGYVLQPMLRPGAFDISLSADFEEGFPAVQRAPLLLHSNLCNFFAA